MTVCLVLQGDSASPGAREKMCSGFPYWRRSMPSTLEGLGRGGLGSHSCVRPPPGRTSPLSLGCSTLLSSRNLAARPAVGPTRPETETLRRGLWCASSPTRSLFLRPCFKVGPKGITHHSKPWEE